MLPKSLPLKTVAKLLQAAHNSLSKRHTAFQRNIEMRNVAVLELLFATGLRVSELCSIKASDIDLKNGFVKVWGKGAKERVIFISNLEALSALRKYKASFSHLIIDTGWFFVNRLGRRLSEQSVRDAISSYSELAKIEEHITPHMLRHSCATFIALISQNKP